MTWAVSQRKSIDRQGAAVRWAREAICRLLCTALLLPFWCAAGALALPSDTSYASDISEATVPSLWMYRDADTVVYLFGSIHMMKPGVAWYGAEVQDAFERSSTLTLELLLTPEAELEIATQALQEGMFRGGERLDQYLSATEFKRLQSMVPVLPAAQLNQFRPWFAGLTVVSLKTLQLGFLPQLGIDKVLQGAAQQRCMDTFALETPAQQLAVLSAGSMAEQVQVLSLTLDDVENLEAEFETMVRYWMDRDLDALDAQMLAPMRDQLPAYSERVFDERNRNWISPLLKMLQIPGQHFVAVGTGHLIGEGSVLDMLRRAGQEIVPVTEALNRELSRESGIRSYVGCGAAGT